MVESWWNGQFGNLGRDRLRLHLHVLNDGSEHWAVEVDNEREWLGYECSDEQAAHDLVAEMTAERPGDWRRVDPAALGHA